jgi:hypothetical protein
VSVRASGPLSTADPPFANIAILGFGVLRLSLPWGSLVNLRLQLFFCTRADYAKVFKWPEGKMRVTRASAKRSHGSQDT